MASKNVPVTAPTIAPSNPAGDVSRVAALLDAITGLVRDLEDHVAANAPDGYYLITALEVCVQEAQAHANAAAEAEYRASAEKVKP